MWLRFRMMVVVCMLQTNLLPAAILGTNTPALPLTSERIAALSSPEQRVWKEYLDRSRRQSQADRESFRFEMRSNGITQASSPPPGRGTLGIGLNQAEEWYAADEARRIAEIIVSYQTPAGGWSKNLDMTKHARLPGEHFAAGNLSRFSSTNDLDTPDDPNWNYVGTFDNGATTTQLRFLATLIAAKGVSGSDAFRRSFLRGMDYIFASQFPNGGWPQVWPLQGGYHDAVTFNDSAMTRTLELLLDVSRGTGVFAFVSSEVRRKAAESLRRGLDCVLATQVIENGKRTAWCQQYDALTLQPTSARNYEMPSFSSGESAGVMLFLMRLPTPDSNVVAAVRGAADWFKRTEIREKSYRRMGNDGFRLVSSSGGGPLWSRYYEFGSHRPIFGDRDKTIHDTLDEISLERRNGYAWYTDAPEEALKQFERWNKTQP